MSRDVSRAKCIYSTENLSAFSHGLCKPTLSCVAAVQEGTCGQTHCLSRGVSAPAGVAVSLKKI